MRHTSVGAVGAMLTAGVVAAALAQTERPARPMPDRPGQPATQPGTQPATRTAEPGRRPATAAMEPVDQARVDQIIGSWPQDSQKAAKEIIGKYGLPQEATASMLFWENNGPWKWTKISNKPIAHNWPMPHTDMLEQAIDYKVKPEMFDELAKFDGSVIVERTKGQISARCDKEGANFLALNLAHDIVTGERDVNEARREFEKQAKAMMNNQPAPLTERLAFSPPTEDTTDMDKPADGMEKK